MRNIHLCLATCVAFSAAPSLLNAQNYAGEAGNFQSGGLTWQLVSFSDTKGSTGFGLADVITEATSEALFVNFQTLTSDVSATYKNTVLLPAKTMPVSFNVMWDKGSVTSPMPSASNNWVQLRIYDRNSKTLFNQRIHAPGQQGAKERASFSGKLSVATSTGGTVEFTAQHSKETNIPYKVWIDDLVVGDAPPWVYHKGCQGTRSRVPIIYNVGSGVAKVGSGFEVWGGPGQPYSGALMAVGSSNQNYGSLKLPVALGGGCLLSQNLIAVYPSQTDWAGTGKWRGQVPNNPKLRGARVYLQWAFADSSPFGFTTTAAMRVTIQ